MVAGAAAGRIGIWSDALFGTLCVEKFLVVGANVAPHLDIGVPFSHEPRPEIGRDLADRARLQPVQLHTVELVLSRRTGDPYFHIDETEQMRYRDRATRLDESLVPES